MLKNIPVDEITRIISLASAPAFILGAVAGLLSLVVTRLVRVSDLIRPSVFGNGVGASPREAPGSG